MLTEPIAAALHVIRVLEDLDVPYFVGGSLAGAVHGLSRSTVDVDIIAALRMAHVEPLVARLGDDFYSDDLAIYRAVKEGSTFNLIHLASMFKVDIFVARGEPFEQSEFSRRTLQPLSDAPQQKAYVASAEDLILAKLVWYRQGGEVSDRQWNDIISVVRVQSAKLDVDYLHSWAPRLGVSDLLECVLAQGEESELLP